MGEFGARTLSCFREAAPAMSISSHREFLTTLAGASAGLAARGWLRGAAASRDIRQSPVISAQLGDDRHFPAGENTHWDYEKGNLIGCQGLRGQCGPPREETRQLTRSQWARCCEQEKRRLAQGDCRRRSCDRRPHLHSVLTCWRRRRQRDSIPVRLGTWLHPRPARGRGAARESSLPTWRLRSDWASSERFPHRRCNRTGWPRNLQKMLLDLRFDWISCKYPVHAGIEDLHASGKPPSDEAYANIVSAQPAAQPFTYPTGLLEIPMSPISDVDFRNGRWRLDDFLKAIRLAMAWVIRK